MSAAAASTFKTHKPALQELLEGIHKGDIQLLDFQRGWVAEADEPQARLGHKRRLSDRGRQGADRG